MQCAMHFSITILLSLYEVQIVFTHMPFFEHSVNGKINTCI